MSLISRIHLITTHTAACLLFGMGWTTLFAFCASTTHTLQLHYLCPHTYLRWWVFAHCCLYYTHGFTHPPQDQLVLVYTHYTLRDDTMNDVVYTHTHFAHLAGVVVTHTHTHTCVGVRGDDAFATHTHTRVSLSSQSVF